MVHVEHARPSAVAEVDIATALQPEFQAPVPLPRWDEVIVRTSDFGYSPPEGSGEPLTPRRLLLYRLIAGGAVGWMATKLGLKVWTETIWPPDVTDDRWLPEGEPLVQGKQPIERVVKIFQGTGRKHGRPYCEWVAHNAYGTLRPGNNTLALYSDLANEGATAEDWGRQIVGVRRFATEMDAVAISAGGASLFAGLLSTIRKGIQPVTLGNCVFVNALFDERAFEGKTAGKVASRYSEFSEGTVVDKAGMWVVDRWAKDRRALLRDIRNNPFDWLGQLYYEATHGSPPVMMGNQVRTIKFGVDLDNDWQELAPAITRDTRFLYVFNRNDRYVDNQISLDTLARFARRFRIPLDVLPTPPGIGHADVEAVSQVIGPWLGLRQVTRGD